MAENVRTNRELKKNKFKAVAEAWKADPKAVRDFLIDIERKRLTFPAVGGPRQMVFRDRTHHTTGDNLVLYPEANERAHALFLKRQEKDVK